MTPPRRTALLALACLTVACSSSPTEPPDGNGDVATISLTPGQLSFNALGLSSQLTAVPRNAAGEALQSNVTWSVTDGSSVSVSTSGLVTALSNGAATVRAAAGGVSAEVDVQVSQVPASIVLGNPPATLTVLGAVAQLDATVRDGNGRTIAGAPISWSSSNALVLPVSDAGLVTAARPGTSTITAMSGAFSASAPIAVTLTGPLGGPSVGTEVPCTAGMAGQFPCSGIKLMSYLPVSGVGGGTGVDLNDIWGWVDPQTNREYAIVMRRDGTAFVDVTDPLNPAYLGHLPIPAGASANVWHDVKVYQNHAFIVADGAGQHGMQVFDLTDLRGVTVPRTFEVVTRYTNIASAHNIFINESTGFAYTVGGSSGGTTCGGGLHMINIQNPANPSFAGCFADPLTGNGGSGYTHDVQCVVYAGPDAAYTGREICFGSNENAISIADVTDKGAPLAVSRANYPAVAYTHQGWLTGNQQYFLVNDELDELQGSVSGTRTLVWDVSDLDDPVLVGQFLGPTTATDHNHYIHGNRMYMSNYQFGLRVADVSNPQTPAQVGFFDTAPNAPNTPGFGGSWSNYPFFPSGNIVVTSRNEGVFVVRMME